jgi:hypothetical protein
VSDIINYDNLIIGKTSPILLYLLSTGKQMNRYLCLVIFFLITSVAFSNDSRIVLGSSVELINNENTNIIMLEEEIKITLYGRYYEVDVSFDFFNDGDEENVLLGFPVWTVTYDNPEEREWAKIRDFQSYINGELVTEYTTIEESEKNLQLTTTTWFVREVTFPGNSHTYSRVTYKAPYNTLGYQIGAGYIYGTGRNWKDSIGKMTVIINHADDTLIDEVSFGWNRSYNELIWGESGTYKYVLENIEPDEREQITVMIRFYGVFDEYKGQFGESWDGEWIWNRSLLEEYSKTNLYTRNQLKLFISFFYAMHGYDFENQLLKNYFQNMPPSWQNGHFNYRVDPSFSENNFNVFERKNIDYLSSLERSIASDDDPSAFDNFMELLISSVELEKTSKKGNDDKDINYPGNEEQSENAASIMGREKTNKQFILQIGKYTIIIILITVICIFVLRRKRSRR